MQLFKIPSPPNDLTCTPDQQAIAARDSLLNEAAVIQAVKTEADNQQVAAVGSSMQRMIKEVESTRKDLTAHYLAAQRAIKETADSFCNPLMDEKTRLGRLAAAYRMEQDRKIESERIARTAEIERLQQAERKAAEDARKAAEAGDLAGALMSDLITAAATNATSVAISAPPPEATKTVGQSFAGRVLGWECVDPVALWNARPELCEPPKPKASAIKAICTPEHPVPGLKLWWESKVTFKSNL